MAKGFGLLKRLSAHRYVALYNVAIIYGGLGEKDQAYLPAVYLTTDTSGQPPLRRRIGPLERRKLFAASVGAGAFYKFR